MCLLSICELHFVPLFLSNHFSVCACKIKSDIHSLVSIVMILIGWSWLSIAKLKWHFVSQWNAAALFIYNRSSLTHLIWPVFFFLRKKCLRNQFYSSLQLAIKFKAFKTILMTIWCYSKWKIFTNLNCEHASLLTLIFNSFFFFCP